MPETSKIEREPIHREPTLLVTDAEIIRRLGANEKIARETFRMLDKNPAKSGFPQKSKLWGGRRYWPAVKAYFDHTNGVNISDRRG